LPANRSEESGTVIRGQILQSLSLHQNDVLKVNQTPAEHSSVPVPLLFVNKSDSPPINFSQEYVELAGRDDFIGQLVVELLVSQIPTALSDAQEFAHSIVGVV
jgi:hypothetical protein